MAAMFEFNLRADIAALPVARRSGSGNSVAIPERERALLIDRHRRADSAHVASARVECAVQRALGAARSPADESRVTNHRAQPHVATDAPQARRTSGFKLSQQWRHG